METNDLLAGEEGWGQGLLPSQGQGQGLEERQGYQASQPQLDEIPEAELDQYCHATTARGLYWGFTMAGQSLIQPCPNGATGLARWQCEPSLSTALPDWSTAQPDLSDCKSVPMTNLEVKVRQEDPENVLASSLARLTGARQLYGGDLQSAVTIIHTIATRSVQCPTAAKS